VEREAYFKNFTTQLFRTVQVRAAGRAVAAAAAAAGAVVRGSHG
jgi:hypothetical protein